MSGIFDIDVGPESPELLAIAREQLRETPEIRKEGFEKLKELLKQNSDLNFPDTEQLMEVVLRCTHWYPESALKLVRLEL
jgi:retinaldehyde-binding protein 1